MTKGPFKSMVHLHEFLPGQQADHTLMKDHFHFESPAGWIGDIVNVLFLTGYMTRLLQKRNEVIKTYAENNCWQELVNRTGEDNL